MVNPKISLFALHLTLNYKMKNSINFLMCLNIVVKKVSYFNVFFNQNVVPIREFFVSSLKLPKKVNSTCNKLLLPIFILIS
jgi:hypothetical protein